MSAEERRAEGARRAQEPHSLHARSRLLHWLFPNGTGTFGQKREDFDPSAVEGTVRTIGRLFGPHSYFGLEVTGLDQIPEPPVLVVSNHSGGTTIPDVWGFLVGWYRKFGVRRPIHPVAHELILSIGPTRRFFGARGVIDANPEIARRVLSEWKRDLLVMPGGDLDTWRPHSERYEVRFGGRKGYARLARRLGIPVVPVANDGAHDTLYVLTDGQRIAERLALHHLARSRIFPIHISLPWGLAFGPWPHIPWPARLRYIVGSAIDPAAFESAEELDEEVRGRIQAQLDELRATKPT